MGECRPSALRDSVRVGPQSTQHPHPRTPSSSRPTGGRQQDRLGRAEAVSPALSAAPATGKAPIQSPDHAGGLPLCCWGAQIRPPHGTSACRTPLLWDPPSHGSSAPSAGCSAGSKQTSAGAISSFPLTASPLWNWETHVPSARRDSPLPLQPPSLHARCPPGALQPPAPKHRHPPGSSLTPPARAPREPRQDRQRGRLLPRPRSQKHMFGVGKDDFLDCSCPACSWLQAGMTGTRLRVEQLNPSKLAAAISPRSGNASSSQLTPFTGR